MARASRGVRSALCRVGLHRWGPEEQHACRRERTCRACGAVRFAADAHAWRAPGLAGAESGAGSPPGEPCRCERCGAYCPVDCPLVTRRPKP